MSVSLTGQEEHPELWVAFDELERGPALQADAERQISGLQETTPVDLFSESRHAGVAVGQALDRETDVVVLFQ